MYTPLERQLYDRSLEQARIRRLRAALARLCPGNAAEIPASLAHLLPPSAPICPNDNTPPPNDPADVLQHIVQTLLPLERKQEALDMALEGLSSEDRWILQQRYGCALRWPEIVPLHCAQWPQRGHTMRRLQYRRRLALLTLSQIDDDMI